MMTDCEISKIKILGNARNHSGTQVYNLIDHCGMFDRVPLFHVVCLDLLELTVAVFRS